MCIVFIDHLGRNGGLLGYTRSFIDSFRYVASDFYVLSTEENDCWKGRGTCFPTFERFSRKENYKFIRLLYLIFAYVKVSLFLLSKHPKLTTLNVFHFSFIELILCTVSLFFSQNVLIILHDFTDLDGNESVIPRKLFAKLFKNRKVACGTHSDEVKLGLLNEFNVKCSILPHLDFSYDRTKIGLKYNLMYDFSMYGRMKTTKGFWDYIVAACNVSRENPSIKFFLGGQFKYSDYVKVKEYLSKHDKFNAIHVENKFFSESEVTKLIHESSWVVLPYLSVYSSGVLLRAIEYEKPLIHSDLKSFNVITQDKFVSLLSEAGNAASLKDAMERALNADYTQFKNNTRQLRLLLIEKNNVYNTPNFPDYLRRIGLHNES